MENAIILIVLAVVAAAVIAYLVRAKKRGQTCVGCPHSKQCGSHCNGHCSTK